MKLIFFIQEIIMCMCDFDLFISFLKIRYEMQDEHWTMKISGGGKQTQLIAVQFEW